MPYLSPLKPVLLYWYRSMDNFAIHMEEYLSGKIHFSSWRNVNDPMEGYFSYYPQRDNVSHLISEKNKYKICCFSRSCSNYLLWSHYAKDHKGVCLEYEIKPNELPGNIIVRNIKYSKEIPEFDNNLPIDKQAVAFLTQKLSCWRYEKETRLLLHDSQNPDIMIGIPKSITLGCRFFDVDIMTNEEKKVQLQICQRLLQAKKNIVGIKYYTINNIRMNGDIIRSETKRFG